MCTSIHSVYFRTLGRAKSLFPIFRLLKCEELPRIGLDRFDSQEAEGLYAVEVRPSSTLGSRCCTGSTECCSPVDPPRGTALDTVRTLPHESDPTFHGMIGGDAAHGPQQPDAKERTTSLRKTLRLWMPKLQHSTLRRSVACVVDLTISKANVIRRRTVAAHRLLVERPVLGIGARGSGAEDAGFGRIVGHRQRI